MTKMNAAEIQRAIDFARVRHSGQTDKAGKPYLHHLLSVMLILISDFPDEATTELAVTAVLHDIIEDEKATFKEVQSLFGLAVANNVYDLRKGKNEPYHVYILRIGDNRNLSMVKYADLVHNSDMSRIPNPTEDDLARKKKYEKSKLYLKGKHGF